MLLARQPCSLQSSTAVFRLQSLSQQSCLGSWSEDHAHYFCLGIISRFMCAISVRGPCLHHFCCMQQFLPYATPSALHNKQLLCCKRSCINLVLIDVGEHKTVRFRPRTRFTPRTRFRHKSASTHTTRFRHRIRYRYRSRSRRRSKLGLDIPSNYPAQNNGYPTCHRHDWSILSCMQCKAVQSKYMIGIHSICLCRLL